MSSIFVFFLFMLGLLGPVAAWQWRDGRWLGAAHWIAAHLSPQFLSGVPMAGVLLITIGLSLVWPPGIILAFLAAATLVGVLFAQSTPRPRHRAGPRPGPPGTRSGGGSLRGSSRPRPRSP